MGTSSSHYIWLFLSSEYPCNDATVPENKYEPWHVISNNVAFWQVYTQTSLCSIPLSLETSNDVQSAALHSKDIQVTSKGSDQTKRMRRLVWAYAGRTYRIVGNLMPRLKYGIQPTDTWQSKLGMKCLSSYQPLCTIHARIQKVLSEQVQLWCCFFVLFLIVFFFSDDDGVCRIIQIPL